MAAPDPRTAGNAISIHVPREGHDCHSCGIALGRLPDFNPRAPRGARRLVKRWYGGADLSFQSTCPARGTTRCTIEHCNIRTNFNPRAPRGARRFVQAIWLRSVLFQSTCPARGTTDQIDEVTAQIDISIHVPREGHDTIYLMRNTPRGDISIHVPREGHDSVGSVHLRTPFYISIHVPREGHDERRLQLSSHQSDISIHVPREGHDSKHAQFFRADLRKSYKYPAERDALPTKNVCKHIKTLG